MPPLHAICILAMALAVVGSANAQSSPEAAIPVGVDNFVRAESDLYLGKMVATGSLGRFVHSREAVPIDVHHQWHSAVGNSLAHHAEEQLLEAEPVRWFFGGTGRIAICLE